jgi:hypothetical protein
VSGIPSDDRGIFVGLDGAGAPVHMRLFIDEAPLLLGYGKNMISRPDPWRTEFAHPGKTVSRRDETPEEEMPHGDREEPLFGIGDLVVFRDSDPATRREWKVTEFDQQHGQFLYGTPPVTCTVSRGSTVKRGVSVSRLEPAAS